VHPLNWAVVIAYLSYVVYDGLRRARGTSGIEGYFLANRSLPWWAAGLSVMATQLSAITMIGTTGQGATDGLKFVQFYFGLPFAMVILGVTLVPFLHGAKIFTAYEYLERRFDAKTRSLTAFLFLVSRGLSCGTIISAPAVVFAAIFGWPITRAVAVIGIPTVIYTALGGVKAVTWADVKQMVLIVSTLVIIVVFLVINIPVHPDAALKIAGAAGRMQAFDFSFDVSKTYTFWSGVLGGTFLMMSYFGTDQSQVQRYLTTPTVDEARRSLLISAYWKIPLQGLILLFGVLVFVFQIFHAPPLLFNPAHDKRVRAAAPAVYDSLEARYAAALSARAEAGRGIAASVPDGLSKFRMSDSAVVRVRTEALALAGTVTHEQTRDVNYVIPDFVLHHLPIGVAGLFIAAVMAAAMSASAAELNSLSTTTVIDFYRRYVRPTAPDAHYLAVGKGATLFWGVIACFVATYAASLGSLIEVVNKFGSFFYGTILGVFLLAMNPRSRALGAFVGMLSGLLAVGLVAFGVPKVSFLWYNVIGATAVFVVGSGLSLLTAKPK